MSTAHRLSTNSDAVTARPGRAAVALALSVATLAVMPAAAEAQGDITIRFERSAVSVHEGDPLGLSVIFSEPPGRVVPEGQDFVTIRFIRTNRGGARNQGDYWSYVSAKVHYWDDKYFVGFGFFPHADDVVDPGESVLFEFDRTTLPDGFVVGEPSTIEVTILDGPSPPPVSTMVTLSASPDSVSEGAGSTRVTVTGTLNSAAFDSDTPVTVSVDNGTAIAGTDFASVSDFTLTIPANETRGTATFNLVPTNDAVDESDETLTVSGSATGLAVDSATMTITDNDTASSKVTLSVNPTAVSEGAGPTTVTVTGTLDGGASTSDTSVTVSVGSGTATAGTDFGTVSNFPLTIPAESKSGTATFTLTPTDDNVAEGTETLTVSGSTTGLTVDSVTLEITDNDTASTKVTLSVNPTSVSEGAGATTVTVTGTLDEGARETATSVTVSVGGGTATAGTDFAAVSSFALNIPAKATSGSQTFTLTPTDDGVAEGAETLTASGTTSGLSVDPAMLTITDNDTASARVTLSLNPTSVSEGAGATTVTVTGTLDEAARATATSVTVLVGDGTAMAGMDFAAVSSFTLTIPATAMSGTQTFTLTPTDDGVAEGAETLTVSGSAAGLTVDSAMLEITDNDTASTKVTLSLNPTSVSEGAGVTTVTVTGTLDEGARETATSVTVSVGGGTATAGTDFAAVSSFTLNIPAKATSGSQTFPLTPTDDGVAEGSETLTVSGTAAGLSVDSATLTITDNDTASARVTLSLNPTSVSEGAGATTVTVTGTLDEAARATATSVAVLVGDGTAMAGMDFTAVSSFTLTIPATAMSGTQTFTLTPTDDGVAEGAETLTVSGSAAGLTVDSATLEITDNDTASTKVTLSVNPTSVSEGAGVTTVTVTGTLDEGARETATSVTVSVGGGTATAGTDFAAVSSFTLNIPAKATSGSQTFPLTPTDDGVAEGSETLTVGGTAAGLSVDSATLTITDNDTASARVTLSLNPASISEGAGATTVTVTGTLDEAARATATSVTVLVGDGTAMAGMDFAAVSSFTLTIPATAMSGSETFTLTPTDDGVAEGAETLTVSGSAAGLTVDSATLEITDNDTASTRVTLSLNPTSVSEGAGVTTVTVTGTLDEGARETATSVTVSVGDGTAMAGMDFAAVSSFTLTIPAKATSGSQTFTLTPTDDGVAEGAETLTVGGTAAGLSVDSAVLTITDNDNASTGIRLSVNPSTVSEGAAPTAVTVTGTLNAAARPAATSVTVSVRDGTAMAGTDFAAVSSFTLTIPAKATSGTQTFTLTPTDDGVAEGAETLTVSGTTTGLDVDSAPLTITDNDNASTKVTLSLNPTSISEGTGATTVTVTGTLDEAARTTATLVTVSVGDGTATAGTDFTAVSSFTLTIPATATSSTRTFTLTPTDDGVAEGAETLTVSGSTAGLNVDSATLTINDNDTASTRVTLSLNPTSVSESAGATTVTVTGTLDEAARATATVVTVSVGSGTATAGTDFAAVSSFTLTIPAKATRGSGTFTLTPTDDGVAEGAETLTVSGNTAGLSVDSATLTILDNDTAPTRVLLSVNPTSVSEGAGGTTVTVTGRLDRAARPTPTSVTVSVGDGTATAGTDFATVSSFTLTIPANVTSGTQTFTLTPTDDGVAEGAETLTVSGSTTATGLTVDSATLTINDNDAAPTRVTLSLNPDTVSEGSAPTTVTVTGTLNGAALPAATSVTVSVGDGTAMAGMDFAAVSSFALTIPANATSGSGTFTLTPTDDGVAEGAETLTVSGSTAGLTVDSATLTINDNDTASTRVTLSLNPTSVSEGAGGTTVTVTGTLDDAARATATSVSVLVGDGTAMAGMDFAAVSSFTLTIPAKATSGTRTFTLTPTDDEVAEGAETLTVSGSTAGLTVDSATLTITDNDTASTRVTLSLNPTSVSEGAGGTTVTVTGTLDDAARPTATSVTVSVGSGTATAGTDFAAVSSFTLTIPAKATSGTQTFALTPTDDGVAEGAETLTVSGTTTGLNVDSATLTITDNDTASTRVTLTLSPTRVSEAGGATTVTVTGRLNEAARPGATTVTVAVDSGTAISGTDFTAVNGFTLTIPASATVGTQTFSLNPTDDNVHEGDETLTVSGTTELTVDGATLTLVDNDASPTKITLSVNPNAVSEGAGTASVTVTGTLDGSALSTPTSVTVEVESGTAISGTDFTAVNSFTLTIDATAMSGDRTFSIVPTDDNVAEGDETVTVSGSTSSDGLSVHSAVLEITDNDTSPGRIALSVNPDAVAEDATSTTVTVTATLDGAALPTATEVTVSVEDGTAISGTDFTAVDSFTLTIPAESKTGTGTFSLTLTDDEVAEGAETLTVSGEASDLTVDAATVTIDDNDTASANITLSVDPDAVAEDTGSATITVTATLDNATRTTSTEVTVSVGDGTAMAGMDFTAVDSFTLTIDAESETGTQTFTLIPTDDGVAEGAETLMVSGEASGLTVDSATLTIDDNDTASGKVTLAVDPDTVAEDADATTITVTATLNDAARPDATDVTVSVGGGTAVAGTDFATVADFTLTIPAKATSGAATFSLTPADDEVAEGEETLTVSGSASGLTVDPATVTITDNDTSTGVTLELSPTEVAEDAGATDVTVTAELDGAVRSTATTVTVSVVSGTATEVEDFDEVQDFTLTIDANERSTDGTFTLTPVDDTDLEENETVKVTGTTGAVTVIQFITITDDDNQAMQQRVKLSMEGDSEWVMEGGGPKDVTVKAELTGDQRDVETRVDVTLDPHEASKEDFETDGENFQILIPARQMSASHTFMFKPMDDEEDETDENLRFEGQHIVPDDSTPLPVDPTTLMIKDNDGDDGGRTNEPPEWGSSSYTFDLQEQRDGRETPLRIGMVSASDPEGEPVRYALASGDGSRFRVGSSSGSLTYVGPGEDYEAGPRRYELRVKARDDDRRTAEVTVVVRVIDIPEAPAAGDDAAETPEDEPVLIDVLANDSDPDGDRLRLAAVTAPEHGTATVEEGGVRYAPSSNYHGSDEFRYTVTDPGGLTATATVRVTVTPVNDAPDAVDDDAETLEDEPVVIDVLANDTDVDGDPIRIVSATAPAHGTTAVGAGGVRYAPALNYHGQDSFDYTIADPAGLTDTATVSVTVLPVNDAPEAVGTVPEQRLEEGGEPLTLDIAEYFTDVDGDVLTYTAESSNPAATAVAVSGSTLTLSAVVRGTATITVTATDPDGLTATQVFGVSVGDRLVREVLTDTLAALGRGHLSSVRQTVGRRLETSGADARRLNVAGQAFGPEAWDRVGSGSLAQTHDLMFRAATLQQRAAATDLVGTSADPRLREPGSFTSFGGFSGDFDQALPATDVLMAFGGGDASAEEPTGGGPRWTVWGQGDLQTFRGNPEPVKGYEGNLRTGYLGIDARVTRRWLFGLAMARSGGSGTWQRGGSAGELSTTLTRVHPYVRWSNGDTAVWGVLGTGRGSATHTRTLTGLRETSPLSLGLGLLEGRRRVATIGRGIEVGVRGEASWAHLATGGGDETIDDLDAGVRRMRGGIELTRALSGPGGLMFTPFGAVSTRHDGGAGQTGVGLEVAGGLRVRGGRVQLEAQGRRLVLHSATAYEEQGVSLAATVGSSPYEPGLTLSLRPTWGAAGMGAETLWQDQIHTYAGSSYDQTGLDTRLGYGMRLGATGLLAPFGSYGQRQNSGRRLQVGALVASLGQSPGTVDGPIQLEVSGERYDRPDGNADHRFSMFGVLNLGGSGPAHGTTTGVDPRLLMPESELVDVAASRDTEPLSPEPASDVMPLDELATTTPMLVSSAIASETTSVEALSPTVAPDPTAASDTILPDVQATVTEHARAVPIESEQPLSAALAEATATTSGLDASPSAVTIAARREEVDFRSARRSTATATRPAAEAPAVRTPTSAAGANRGGRRTPNPAAGYAPAAPGRALRPASVTDTRTARTRRSPGTNQPPMFSAPTYAFELAAGRSGRGTAGPLGVVLARDPDRDPVTYSLTAGDWTRFEVDPSSGSITYLGPDLPGTRRYELQITARDTGRLTETATVTVTVASASAAARIPAARATTAPARNAPARPTPAERPLAVERQAGATGRAVAPVRAAASRRTAMDRAVATAPRRANLRRSTAAPGTAVADAARTYRDLPVLVDVLSNDANLEGLRIVAVTAPAHGTTTVADGMVRYAPAPGHRGRDTFTYTVVSDGGRTARATVTVMVAG